MADTRDYYDILGVSKTATAAEIKTAYRKLALQYHPDRNKTKEAEEKFKEVTKAYEVLSNEEKRKTYDQFGQAAFEQGAAGQGGAGGGPFGGFGGQQGGQYGPFSYTYSTGGNDQGFDFGGFSDPFEIFEQFFGGGAARPRRPVYSLTIDFKDAVHGAEKEVTIDNRKQKIKIPAGVDRGSRIRFDNYDIVVDVTPDSRFSREGYDIITEESVSYPDVALGKELSVETIDGPVKIRIPAGTQPNTLIRLSGRGVKRIRSGGNGDHYVKIKVAVPKKVSHKQKELLEALQKEESGATSETKQNKSWF